MADEKKRNAGEQTVEEDFAGNEHGSVLVGGLAHEETIESPADGCAQGHDVAEAVELEYEMAVEDNEPHADDCDGGTDNQAGGGFGLGEDNGEECGAEWGGAYDEGDVVYQCVLYGKIFGVEV